MPLAQASEHSIVIPTRTAVNGSEFIVETVIHNLRTGERAVISEECLGNEENGVASIDCIQVKPEPQGMQIFVKTYAGGRR